LQFCCGTALKRPSSFRSRFFTFLYSSFVALSFLLVLSGAVNINLLYIVSRVPSRFRCLSKLKPTVWQDGHGSAHGLEAWHIIQDIFYITLGMVAIYCGLYTTSSLTQVGSRFLSHLFRPSRSPPSVRSTGASSSLASTTFRTSSGKPLAAAASCADIAFVIARAACTISRSTPLSFRTSTRATATVSKARPPQCCGRAQPVFLLLLAISDTVFELPVSTEAAFNLVQFWLCLYTLVFVLLNWGRLNSIQL
jgi:hypothetical protein